MTKDSNFLNDDILPPVRSTFLTVLCVLTFIGSAYGIYQGITTIVSSGKMSEMMKNTVNNEKQAEQRKQMEAKNDKGSKFGLKMMDSVKEMSDEKKLKQAGVVAIIGNLLTLGGAILMWRLNRVGFFVYLAGIVTWVGAPIVIYGPGAFLPMVIAAFSFFVGLLFVILYAMNLKDMRNTQLS